jgi:hypothetical protein
MHFPRPPQADPSGARNGILNAKWTIYRFDHSTSDSNPPKHYILVPIGLRTNLYAWIVLSEHRVAGVWAARGGLLFYLWRAVCSGYLWTAPDLGIQKEAPHRGKNGRKLAGAERMSEDQSKQSAWQLVLVRIILIGLSLISLLVSGCGMLLMTYIFSPGVSPNDRAILMAIVLVVAGLAGLISAVILLRRSFAKRKN